VFGWLVGGMGHACLLISLLVRRFCGLVDPNPTTSPGLISCSS
jgi:hypothetical protein